MSRCGAVAGELTPLMTAIGFLLVVRILAGSGQTDRHGVASLAVPFANHARLKGFHMDAKFLIQPR